MTGKRLACFIAPTRIFSVAYFPQGVFIGCESGEVIILHLDKNLLSLSGPVVVTIRQLWDFAQEKYLPLSTDCPLCGYHFLPPVKVLETIHGILKNQD